jgi:phosphoglycolate phosphatase
VSRGVLFDLDGTLADTPQAIATILTKVLADRGAQSAPEAVRACVGMPLERSLAGLLGLPPEHPEVAAAAADYQQRFRDHLLSGPGDLCYPGVAGGLRRLAAAGLLLGVATSKPRRAAERMLGLMGVADLFRAVAGDDTVRRGKPDPEMALHVAEQLGVPPRECVVVGDGLADVGMGRAAGMPVIGVSYGVADGPQLSAAGARHIAASFDEVVDLLLAHGQPQARTQEPR